MKYNINIKVNCDCSALNIDGKRQFTITVEDDIKDIIPYLFYKKYDKPYNELSWYLEDGAREFVKDLEDKWLKNTLDTFALYHNTEFIDYLSDNYTYTLSDDQLETLMEEFKDDVISELDDLEWEDLKWLYESEGSDIDLWVENYHDTVDLEGYIEDHAWLYDEEEE